ncbi:MAG: L,D-transpeptidase family protein [Candidatus Ozemobacteraceae bacterium]
MRSMLFLMTTMFLFSCCVSFSVRGETFSSRVKGFPTREKILTDLTASGTTQVIIVLKNSPNLSEGGNKTFPPLVATSGDNRVEDGLELIALENRNGTWTEVFRTRELVVGRSGFAAPGAKVEGDGKTPTGIYLIGQAFGYEASVSTKLAYRQATENDVWVDDPKSLNYNLWVDKNNASATSFEFMKRKDNLYKFGFVIEYNTDPITAGAGSAIFFHVWRGPGKPTSGCVATPESFIISLLAWLDAAKHPRILLGLD